MMGTAFEVKIFTTGNEEANPLIAPSAGLLVILATKACAGNSVLEDMCAICVLKLTKLDLQHKCKSQLFLHLGRHPAPE